MGRLGWTLLFGSLFVVALALLGLIGLRLWRSVKALSHDLARASDVLADLGPAPERPARR
jgi:hypothetical protein